MHKQGFYIRDTWYPNASNAAKVTGIDVRRIRRALQEGGLDDLYRYNDCPVTVRGVEYPNIEAVCKRFKVSRIRVRKARSTGTLDRIGLTKGRRVSYTIAGVTYESSRIAAQAFGVSVTTIQGYARAGRLDDIPRVSNNLPVQVKSYIGPRPIVYKGKEYRSRAALTRALGLKRNAVTSAIHRGQSIESIGISRNTPVEIKGVKYSSITEAAQALNVSSSTITRALDRGTLDTVGQTKPNIVPVTVGGVKYRSLTAAAKALGITVYKVQCARAKGNLDSLLCKETVYKDTSNGVT